jgi:hypothetical protein
MNRLARHTLSLWTAAATLAGCGGSGLGSHAPVPIGSSADVVRGSTGACKGTGGTSITPCPVTLTYKGDNVNVKVSAEGISYATANDASCHVPKQARHHTFHWYCHVTEFNGKNYIMDVFPGKVCGTATVPFKAHDANGDIIGTVRLPITNQSCPSK